MKRNESINGLRIGNPNNETNDQFNNRGKEIIFDCLCLRYNQNQNNIVYS
jgi:hypothetical protein